MWETNFSNRLLANHAQGPKSVLKSDLKASQGQSTKAYMYDSSGFLHNDILTTLDPVWTRWKTFSHSFQGPCSWLSLLVFLFPSLFLKFTESYMFFGQTFEITCFHTLGPYIHMETDHQSAWKKQCSGNKHVKLYRFNMHCSIRTNMLKYHEI